jgi:hypothetical protein
MLKYGIIQCELYTTYTILYLILRFFNGGLMMVF